MLRTFLKVPIIVVTIKFYDDADSLNSEPEIIQWDVETIKKLQGKKCLIIDEVFDSGSTLVYVIDRLRSEGVSDLSVMVIHHKVKESNHDIFEIIRSKLQSYHMLVEIRNEWIVYPWEALNILEHGQNSILTDSQKSKNDVEH